MNDLRSFILFCFIIAPPVVEVIGSDELFQISSLFLCRTPVPLALSTNPESFWSSRASYSSGGVIFFRNSGTSLAPIRFWVSASTSKESVIGALRT